jgi:transcriptional regulator with XRE-family HTH domain
VAKPKTRKQAEVDGATELVMLGARVCKLRAGRGLSQEALSAATGISRPTISKIERGVEDVGVVRLHRLAEVLGVGVADLFAKSSND